MNALRFAGPVVGLFVLSLAGCSAADAGGDPTEDPQASGETAEAIQATASVRDGCGDFEGQVYHDSNTLWVTGTLRDTCGAGTYNQLFVDYDSHLAHFHSLLGTAGPHAAEHVNLGGKSPGMFPAHIKLTVCGHYDGGWHCGASQGF